MGYGWRLEDSKLVYQWKDGKAVPDALVEILQQDASEDSKSDEEIDFNNNLDVVYEDFTDCEALFWYAYIKNKFHIYCFLIKHKFRKCHLGSLLNQKSICC